MTIRYFGLENIHAAARQVIEFSSDYSVWLFDGDLGAGKTTLIKAICDEMKVIDTVSSPTFSLLNVYQTQIGKELYHFDFYRIEDQMEAIDIGCDEYFYSKNYCFVEWPEKIHSLIPPRFIKISIKLDSENERVIRITTHD